MTAISTLTIGTIGSGSVAQSIAGHAVAAGYRVVLSNSRGPESLSDLVAELGPNASAGTVAEAAQADLVILATGWAHVPEVAAAVADWSGRIVIDATNQQHAVDGDSDLMGTERNAALLPGAHVVKAFNTLFARVTKPDPARTDGRLIVFLAGDDAETKATTSAFIDSLGFAPVDIGGATEGRIMEFGSQGMTGLVGLHAVKLIT